MRSTRRFGITALTAAISLAIPLGALGVTTSILGGGSANPSPLPVSPASAGPTTPAYTPYGWLALETGSVNRTTLSRVSPYPTSPEYVGGAPTNLTENLFGLTAGPNGCLLSSESGKLNQNQKYLSFSAFAPGSITTNAASLAVGSIGAAEKRSGVSCAQVDATRETLTLRLGPEAKTVAGSLLASAASLDVELKQGAQILATAYTGGPTGTVKGRFGLVSGSTVTAPASWGPADPTTIQTCEAQAADSGSDSGVNDNCRWAISAPSWAGPDDGIYFDTLVLEALNGSFSLEGGADGLVRNPPPSGFPQRASLIELVQPYEGTLLCGDSVTEGIGGATNPDPDAPKVTVRRLDNADGARCVRVPYTLGYLLQQANFYKPLDLQTSAQFVIDVVWRVPVTADVVSGGVVTPSAATIGATNIDFELPGGRGPINLGWCPDPKFRTGTTILDGLQVLDAVPDLEPTATPNTKEYTCLGTRDARVVPVAGVADYVLLHDQIYLLGDAAFRYK